MTKINIALILTLFLVTNVTSASTSTTSRDSSDYQGERSHLVVMIDAATGCHYLSAGGSLIRRMDEKGRHICGGRVMEEHLMYVAKEKSKQATHDIRTLEIKEMEKRSRD